MDEVQTIIDDMNPNEQNDSVGRKLKGWHVNQFDWASDYVYGIEADYRLVKTAKVSCFLNGDGTANVIHADGLDSFRESKDYVGMLKELSPANPQDNGQFDILVANPPYSVSAFERTLKHGKESFDLYDRLTDDSSEIECLFIERAKQLLKPGGWAAIILPSSILSNSGIYTGAREIILKYFEIKAITEFGSNTFMATGTNTVTLFLERRPNNKWKEIEQTVKRFFENPKEGTVNGIEKAFGKYVAEVFTGLELTDYISLVNRVPNKEMSEHELFVDYRKWFDGLGEVKALKTKRVFKELSEAAQDAELERLFYDRVFAREQDRMLYFFLALLQRTVVIKTGDKQAEKNFIGYEFSSRRGHEGIRMFRDAEGKPTTKLYDNDDPLNPAKASSYVYKALLGEVSDVDATLTDNIKVVDTVELMNFKPLSFEKSLSLNVKKKVLTSSRWGLTRVGAIALVKGGKRVPLGHKLQDQPTEYPYIRVSDFKAHSVSLQSLKFVSEATFAKISNYTISSADVYISIAGTIGLVGTVPEELDGKSLTENAAKIVIVNKEAVCQAYLVAILSAKEVQEQIRHSTKTLGVPKLALKRIRDIQVPLPPKAIQEQIATELKETERRTRTGLERITQLKTQMESCYQDSKQKYQVGRITNYIELVGGGTPSTKESSGFAQKVAL